MMAAGVSTFSPVPDYKSRIIDGRKKKGKPRGMAWFVAAYRGAPGEETTDYVLCEWFASRDEAREYLAWLKRLARDLG